MNYEIIKQTFGLYKENINNNSNQNIVELSTDVYDKLLNMLKADYGNEVLKFGMSPDKYMHYQNGKVSSILKNQSGKIGSHEGFDIISITDIADSIFSIVQEEYISKTLKTYNDLGIKFMESIAIFRNDIRRDFQYEKELDYFDELSAYKMLLNDIRDELGIIVSTPARRLSYLNKIVDMKTNIYKMYNDFLRALRDDYSMITAKDNFGNYLNYQIDYPFISNHFSACRQLICTYTIILINEYALNGNITDKQKNILIKKISNMKKEILDLKKIISDALKNRKIYNDNFWTLFFSNGITRFDSNDISILLKQMESDEDYELDIIRNYFSDSKKYLENIKFTKEIPNTVFKADKRVKPVCGLKQC